MVAPAPSPLSTRRKLLFSAVMLVLFLGALLGAEAALWATWGSPPPHDQLARLSQCRVEADTTSASLRCHPATEANTTVPRTHERPRVVVLGGSSVRATWDMGPGRITFTDALQDLVSEAEFVNFGVTGLGAGSVARLSSELGPATPDLVLLYTGHNDYNGDVFNGRIRGLKLWAGPIYRITARSWLHALLFRQRRDVPRRDPRAFINAVTTPGALALRDEVDARFADDLGLAIRRAPAPVIVSTLLRNPAFPPTGHDVRGRPECALALERLRNEHRDPSRALREVEPRCGEGAVTSWLRFRAAAARGAWDEADAHWRTSLDQDALPLRAPSSADDIIRRVAAEEGATLVDLEDRFGPRAPEGWFTDTLHFSRQGARSVAEALAPTVRASLAGR